MPRSKTRSYYSCKKVFITASHNTSVTDDRQTTTMPKTPYCIIVARQKRKVLPKQ